MRGFSVLVLLFTASGGELAAEPPRVDFAKEILPLLEERCFGCHTGTEAVSGIRLDARAEILGETNGESLVHFERPDSSRLLIAVRHADPEKRMPRDDEALTEEEISLLTRWVNARLPWDDAALPPPKAPPHWAYQPLRRPAVPPTRDAWVRTPVDAFVAERLAEAGLTPNPPAALEILVRRVALDLMGLPPAALDREEFAAGRLTWEALIERYLASPRYGERWGRHWLDVVRWAESEGYESNHPRPHAWRYRDYVVDSFNRDRPFDQFLTQQIAGDELPEYSDENLIATGFLAAARISSNEEDKWLQRNDVNVDVVNAVGEAFLGLTWHCAQCHNHKFDPISARDYYSLQAFFVRGQPVDAALRDPELVAEYAELIPPEYEPARKLKQALFDKIRPRIVEQEKSRLTEQEWAAWSKPLAERTPSEELLARRVDLTFQKASGSLEKFIPEEDRTLYDEVKRKVAALEKSCPPIPQTYAWYSPATSPHRLEVLPALGFYPIPFDETYYRELQTYLMVRGDVHNIGPVVKPDVPAILRERLPLNTASETPTRRDLARWMTDPRHPLTARVWVNRIWQFHFGTGLVETPGDFGVNGARPTHPELLDWLACELIDNGWRTKHVHRLILHSAAYRFSTAARDEAVAADPENRWLWRFDPRRLEVEAIRDSMLAVSGRLDESLGGPSVPEDQREASTRRSLYLFQKRGKPTAMLNLFDGPNEAAESCGRRILSTSPLQSLYLLNDQFTLECARAIAADVTSIEGDSPARIAIVFQRILGRVPSPGEVGVSLRLLEQVADRAAEESESPWTLLCQALLNTSEFVYLE